MRPPLTIWRFITADLLRLIAITTLVFVFMLAFAATVKFFAEGKLSLTDMVIFVIFAVPPMLHYALPFASGFGATLAYHRLEQDNERVGIHAGGVSHRAILMPALVIGLGLSALLWLVNQEIAPRYLRRMEELVVDRVGKVLVSTIESGEPVVFDRWMIYADQIWRLDAQEPEDGAVAPYERFALTGVGAVQLDEEGGVDVETTAGVALVDLYHGGSLETSNSVDADRSTVMVFHVQDATTWSKDNVRAAAESFSDVLILPDHFDDSPKYLTRSELAEAKRNPDLLNVIDVRRRDLAYHEAQRRVLQVLRASLRETGQATLFDETGRRFTLHGEDIPWKDSGYDVVPGELGVVLDQHLENGRILRTTADRGTLHIPIGEDIHTRDLRIDVALDHPRTTELDEGGNPTGPPGGRTELHRNDLRLQEDPLPSLLAMNSDELMAEVQQALQERKDDEFVGASLQELRRRIAELKREITSKQHERMAMAASCLVMVMSGAIVALRLGRGQPLTAYLWSFFPAIVSIVTVSIGQQVGHSAGLIGFVLLWAGVVGLAAYALVAYVGLVRH